MDQCLLSRKQNSCRKKIHKIQNPSKLKHITPNEYLFPSKLGKITRLGRYTKNGNFLNILRKNEKRMKKKLSVIKKNV